MILFPTNYNNVKNIMRSEKNVKNKINKNKTHIFTRYYIITTIIMLEI